MKKMKIIGEFKEVTEAVLYLSNNISIALLMRGVNSEKKK